MNIGQAEWTTGVGEGEFFVVDAKLVQDGRLDVVHMNWIFDRSEPKFIRFSDRLTTADPTARHPHGKGLRVMVTAELSSEGCTGFDHGGSPEFSAPNNQRVFQHASLLQILDQSCACLVCLFALLFDSIFDIAVMIPAGVVKLYESYTSFSKSSGQQAILGEGSGVFSRRAVQA